MKTSHTGGDLLLLSDFNADVLAGLFNNDTGAPRINAVSSGFEPVIPVLLNGTAPLWQQKQAALVWTRPEGVSETFVRAKLMEPVNHDSALQEVDIFCDAMIAAGARVGTMLVATWHLNDDERGYGMLDLHRGLGIRSLLARMNQRLIERLDGQKGIYVLDSTRWFACKEPDNTKMWYLAKVPFSNDVFKAAIGDLKSALRGVSGDARKIVICDLDEMLWGGIVGDVGWENLCLGGHDPIGEALVDFQRSLKALTNRGIILAIVSKNTENIALEAIDKHPEMVLRTDDFAGWRINWNDKAQNVADLLSELNLGQQSAVFLDDSPHERARVRDALPEVLVPELPHDKMLYAGKLRDLDCFNVPFLSEEDRNRAPMYTAERERRAGLKLQQASGKVASLDDWLPTLQIKVQAEPLNAANQRRAGQLFNKTNQMNLTTRRMTESQLVEWTCSQHRMLWTYCVADKFGDSGLTGIASLEFQGDRALVTDYILSCRVMGKRIEETIVHQIAECARTLGAKKLIAHYQPTQKNNPCLEFWQRSGFLDEGNHTYAWDLGKSYPNPDAIELTVNQEDS